MICRGIIEAPLTYGDTYTYVGLGEFLAALIVGIPISFIVAYASYRLYHTPGTLKEVCIYICSRGCLFDTCFNLGLPICVLKEGPTARASDRAVAKGVHRLSVHTAARWAQADRIGDDDDDNFDAAHDACASDAHGLARDAPLGQHGEHGERVVSRAQECAIRHNDDEGRGHQRQVHHRQHQPHERARAQQHLIGTRSRISIKCGRKKANRYCICVRLLDWMIILIRFDFFFSYTFMHESAHLLYCFACSTRPTLEIEIIPHPVIFSPSCSHL